MEFQSVNIFSTVHLATCIYHREQLINLDIYVRYVLIQYERSTYRSLQLTYTTPITSVYAFEPF